MFKRLLWGLSVTLYVLPCFAQKPPPKKFNVKERFIASVGPAFTILKPGSETLYGMNATPSLNLLNRFSDFSASLALNAGVGHHSSSGSDTVEYFSYSFPLFVQVNAGHLASQDFYAALGLFAGAGYNISIINGGHDKGFSWTAGMRTWILKQSFTLRYIQSHLEDSEIVLHEISLQVNVGKYLSRVKDNNKLSRFVSPFGK